MDNTKKEENLEYYLNGDSAIVFKEGQGYFISATPETQRPEDNYTFGDIVKSIYEGISEYGLWYWCTVEIRKAGTEQFEYLGMCSFKDVEDFIRNSGYLEDMISELEG